MNRRNIRRVINAIKAGQIRKRKFFFNMNTFGCPRYDYGDGIPHVCGTAACIAGYAAAVAGNNIEESEDSYLLARNFLDIDGSQALALFYPHSWRNKHGHQKNWDDMKPRHAIRVLEHLSKTGEVDWTKAGR